MRLLTALLSKLTDKSIRDDPASFGDYPHICSEMRPARNSGGGSSEHKADGPVQVMFRTHHGGHR